VACPADHPIAIGGGASASNKALMGNIPTKGSNGKANGWSAQVSNGTDTITVSVICAP
jgi:hypothetical protein